MSRVEVNEKVLNWALDRSGQTPEDLEGKFPKIKSWLSGEVHPTLKQLETLAKKTMTPLGFFFLEEPPEVSLPIPHFRTLGDEDIKGPSPDLIETVQNMLRRQVWMRDYLIEQGHEELSFIRSAQIDEQPYVIAQRMRSTLGFGEGWASQYRTWKDAHQALREAMDEVAGILVVVNGIVGNNTHRGLDPSEFRGFVLADEYAPLVFVNNKDWKTAQMFTLAHELAHLFFGQSAAFDLRRIMPADVPIEQACNRVAAEFLVPEREIKKVWTTVKGRPEAFQTIARHFKVSAIVGARRALDLGLISQSVFFDFYHDHRNEGQRTTSDKSGGGDFHLNQNYRVGRRFASAVIRATKEGKLLYSEAYRLTGLYGKTFEKYASRLGFGVAL